MMKSPKNGLAVPRIQIGKVGNGVVENLIDPKRLQSMLGGVDVHYLDEVDSTNDWALRELGDDGGAFGSRLYIVNHQVAGRGRGKNTWLSQAGSLTFSLTVPCSFGLQDPQRALVALAAGCGVCSAVEQLDTSLKPGIKWPNDVLLAGRKFCGILVETSAKAKDQVVIGCGLNVNNSFRTGDSSDVFDTRSATSILDQFPDKHDKLFGLTEVAYLVVRSILDQMNSLQRQPAEVVQFIRDRDWLLGRRVKWTIGNDAEKSVEAVSTGIATDGSLLLEVEGQIQKIFTGSILALE